MTSEQVENALSQASTHPDPAASIQANLALQLYDPTNGTISDGDLVRILVFSGERLL